MQSLWFRLLPAALILVLTGCAGAGVVATSDPHQKLSDAIYLFNHEDRPSIAEKLIREAIQICKDNSDQLCLADAYEIYGILLKSASVGHWEQLYRKYGFRDESVSFDNRYTKSIEYFKKSRQMYAKIEHFESIPDVYINIGYAYMLMGKQKLACQAFDESAASSREALRKTPDHPVLVPKGYSSYEEYVAFEKKRAGCP